MKLVTIQVPEGSIIIPPGKPGPLDALELSSKKYLLSVLTNIGNKMSGPLRKSTVNWAIVRDYLMSGTSKGGRTSSIEMCLWLGINPDAYKF